MKARGNVAEESCALCNQMFLAGRQDVIYCSAACKQKVYRQRKASGMIVALLSPDLVRAVIAGADMAMDHPAEQGVLCRFRRARLS